MLEERTPWRGEHVDLAARRAARARPMAHPAGDDRDVADPHGAHIAIDVELELTLNHENDLLLLVHVHRRLRMRREGHEIEHGPLAEHRPKDEARDELDGADGVDVD